MCVSVCVSFQAHTRLACRPIGIKFGTYMQNHLERVVGQIKIAPCDLGGHLEGGWGLGAKKSGQTTKRLDRWAPNLAHMFGFIWEWT